ncbi:hypothetical protein PISMIDRAFT_680785 [Pisolithus microcarpus 441]|uniref:Uncharacterized protein n=1 Tax=Pisolithus microcarpus 441 TaxID=765257 RepID=A0A0C9ZHR1_9AGAM|nr:hypothetical protein PISMIDRAFT_680785 [Pisolithus microcarpus 441]
MLGADADRRSGEEKEGGKALNGSQVETVDSMLWESARRQKQPGVSLYEEDLRSRSRPRSRFVRGPSRPHSCSPRFRPYKRSKRSGKAKEIETYSSHKTLDNSDTALLSIPNQPVMGSSRTARDNITSNATVVDKNPVESIKEDGTSDVDVEGAASKAMDPDAPAGDPK